MKRFTSVKLGAVCWSSSLLTILLSSCGGSQNQQNAMPPVVVQTITIHPQVAVLNESFPVTIKGKADIAVGNIVGSNLFNILFVVGISAVITPVVYDQAFLADTLICILTAVLLWLCVFRKQKLARSGGAILLVCYAGYFIYLLH